MKPIKPELTRELVKLLRDYFRLQAEQWEPQIAQLEQHAETTEIGDILKNIKSPEFLN